MLRFRFCPRLRDFSERRLASIAARTLSYERLAARQADLSSQTVAKWHTKPGANRSSTLSTKEQAASLSYLQLVVVAVVASFRKAGVSLAKIETAREYLAKQLEAVLLLETGLQRRCDDS